MIVSVHEFLKGGRQYVDHYRARAESPYSLTHARGIYLPLFRGEQIRAFALKSTGQTVKCGGAILNLTRVGRKFASRFY